MNSATLDSIKEHAARIAREYTNGWLNARLIGAGNIDKLNDDSLRVTYLAGVIDYIYLIGTTPYLGGTAITDADVLQASQKLWHYSGRYKDTALSGFTQVTPDEGDSGSTTPSTPSQDADHYRAGSLAVVAGANAVTFIKDGVASPLPSASYTLEAWVITSSGQRQSELVITTKTAGGFVASDVLKAGTLYYQALLNT